MKPKIQVFIATYNRPTFVVNAISSAIKQDFDSFEVIVSDNSTNDETFKLIKTLNLSKVKYIRRIPSLSVISHLNSILDSIESEYFMIFHDDDLMHVNMIKTLYETLNNNKNAIAAGSNARIVKNGKILKNRFNKRLKEDININCISEMVINYSLPAIVPFPSYMYRKEVAQRLRFDFKHGGKHCDVAFIVNLLTIGPVIFVAKSLMDYNYHDNQDSAVNDFKAYSQLILYLQKLLNYKRTHPIIRRMRIQNIYSETKFNLLNNKLNVRSKRYSTIIRILFIYSTLEYFIKILVITLYSQFFFSQHSR